MTKKEMLVWFCIAFAWNYFIWKWGFYNGAIMVKINSWAAQ